MAIPSGNPQHPLRGTGDYHPPPFVDPQPLLYTGQQAPSLSGVPVWPSVAAEHHAGLQQRAAGRETGNAFLDLVDILRHIYPPTGGAKGEIGPIGEIIRNNRPVADRQTLTMAASDYHPFDDLGPYTPPEIVGPVSEGRARGDLSGQREAAVPALLNVLRQLYPGEALDPFHYQRGIQNSQAIGDRPVTTMTNPLPAYNPLTMVKGQAAAQLRTLINHALAQRGLTPLINTPLPVGPTQMGAR